jgi:site-specific recombinase XerD
MTLSALITEYVSFKQAMGMSFASEAKIFKSFLNTIEDRDLTTVAPSSVAAFLTGKGPITATWHLKFRVLTGLYRFARSRGYVSSSPLPTTVPREPEPVRPYIYSTEELRRLLAATEILKTPKSPLQAATIKILLLTLYGTGLRIGEALALNLADFSYSDCLLVVRVSKFFKTRMVPLGPNLTDQLQSYLLKRRLLPHPAGENSALFATRTGSRLSYRRVRRIYSRLRKLAGIQRPDGVGFAPRIHDLRHTFAVHRLELWYREGADVQRLLPQLATYLGHVGVSETQRYLTMTPELLHEANRRFESYALSEVNHD